MADRINPNGAPGIHQLMGSQSTAFQRNKEKLTGMVANPTARMDQYVASGEKAAQLMIEVMERTAERTLDAAAEEALLQEAAEEGELTAENLVLAKPPEDVEEEDGIPEEGEEEKEGGAAAIKSKDAAPEAEGGGGPGVTKSTAETHCFCAGEKHDKSREGSEECYAIITSMTDAGGNPVDSPEVGQRIALDQLE